VASGRRLDEALADPALNVPPVYRAVVAAGLRSGRLPVALESLAESARHVHQLRSTVVLAMIYPLLLVTVAYSLLVLLLTVVLPAFELVYEQDPPTYLQALTSFGRFALRGIPLPFVGGALP